MRWHLNNNSWSWQWFLNTAEWEVPLPFLEVVVLSEFVDTSNVEYSSISNKVLSELDLIAGQVTISDELLTWLVHIKGLWQSLSPQVD